MTAGILEGIFGLIMIAGAVMTIGFLIFSFQRMKEEDGWRSAVLQMTIFAIIVLTGAGAWITHR